jgi:diguanylate cyclase (GGDEF)-like protein
LVAVAARINGQLDENAVSGRIGGDEFTVMIRGLVTREHVQEIADRLLAALAKSISVDGKEIVLTASIGVAAYPLDGADPPSLIANADAAMYAAKTEERNAVR